MKGRKEHVRSTIVQKCHNNAFLALIVPKDMN